MFDPPAAQLQLQLQRESAPPLLARAASATQVIHLSSAVRHLWPHKRRWPEKSSKLGFVQITPCLLGKVVFFWMSSSDLPLVHSE